MQHDARMRCTHSITYDAPADRVFAMLADPDFRHRATNAMGVISADVNIIEEGEGMLVDIDQVQPTEGVPSFAKKFAGETTRARQVERWASKTAATITIDTPGKPTSFSGTLSLKESEGRTTETMEGELKVKVPLIGGKLESLMADLIGKGMDVEHEVGVAYLQEDH